MSKEALIKREGKWESVHISEVTKNEENGEFICNGRLMNLNLSGVTLQ